MVKLAVWLVSKYVGPTMMAKLIPSLTSSMTDVATKELVLLLVRAVKVRLDIPLS